MPCNLVTIKKELVQNTAVKNVPPKTNPNFQMICTDSLQGTPKAELLQLRPNPIICMRNFTDKKVGNLKN